MFRSLAFVSSCFLEYAALKSEGVRSPLWAARPFDSVAERLYSAVQVNTECQHHPRLVLDKQRSTVKYLRHSVAG